MNWLDIVILVLLAMGTILGLKTGVIKAALSLAGVILGVVLAGRYHASLAEPLSSTLQPGVAAVVAFAVILIGVLLVASLAARLLERATSALLLGWVNHLGGAVLGLLLGAILSGTLLAIWTKFFGITEVISQSTMAAILLDRFPLILALLPEEFAPIRTFFK